MTPLFTLPYHADWSLRDYVDLADYKAETEKGMKVHSSTGRVYFVDGQRKYMLDGAVPPGSTVFVGDAVGLYCFCVDRVGGAR